MNVKSHIVLLFFSVGIFYALDQQPCHGMVKKFQRAHEEIMKEAQEQITFEPEATLEIQRKMLMETRDKIEQPADRSVSALVPIKEQIDRLLEKEQVKPDEIAALKEELDRVARDQGSGLDRAEYVNLAEKVDMAYRFADTLDQLQRSQSVVKKLNNNFNAFTDSGEKTEFRFNASLIANIVLVVGLVSRIGNITNSKLERQLKQLQIAEKRAKLEQDGIDPNTY